MAYSTLDQLRQNVLNPDLGVDDTDTTWGTTTERNAFLRAAFQELWPTMGRQLRQTVEIVDGESEYDLTTLGKELREIERIDLVDAYNTVQDRITSWQLYRDETSDPPKMLLTVPPLDTTYTMRVYGWQPYSVPATGSSTCDLPSTLEYVVSAGGVYHAYRAKFNSYVNFERLSNENRANAVSAAELMEMLRIARADWQDAVKRNQLEMTAPRRAQRTVS